MISVKDNAVDSTVRTLFQASKACRPKTDIYIMKFRAKNEPVK